MKDYLKFFNLKEIREAEGKTQEEAAAAVEIPVSTYRNWEQLKNNPRPETAMKLADYFGCDVNDFITRNDIPQNAIRMAAAPVAKMQLAGTIAAGDPLEMIEFIEEIDVNAQYLEDHPDGFWLRVGSDSMNNVFPQNMVVLIDPRIEPHNGDIAAINVNGYDATLKRYSRNGDEIVLTPDSSNPEHKTRVIDSSSPDAPNVRIIGTVCEAMYLSGTRF